MIDTDVDDDKFIGWRVRDSRREAGFTQAELSAKIDLSEEELKKIETGFRPASQELIKKISEVCGKEYDWFFE